MAYITFDLDLDDFEEDELLGITDNFGKAIAALDEGGLTMEYDTHCILAAFMRPILLEQNRKEEAAKGV